MTNNEYTFLIDFFNAYTAGFISRAKDPHPYILKRDHTLRVCDNVAAIAGAQAIPEGKFIRAKSAALLHDIGRFRQYERYDTYLDRSSENHAVAGIKVIEEHNLLSGISPIEKKQIIRAVALHNVHHLSEKLDGETLWLTRLVRDADKIDILQVMIGHYGETDPIKNQYITLNLENDHRISDELIQSLFKKESIDNRKVKTLNDLKLLQISWVFDLNFKQALEKVVDLKLIPRIIATMPGSDQLDDVSRFINQHVAEIL